MSAEVVLLPTPIAIEDEPGGRAGDSIYLMNSLPLPNSAGWGLPADLADEVRCLIRLTRQEKVFFGYEDLTRLLFGFSNPSPLSYIPYEGMYVLASALKSRGIEVECVDVDLLASHLMASKNSLPSSRSIAEEVSSRRPRVIGISFNYSVALNKARHLIAELKTRVPGAVIIGGGRHASHFPGDCLDIGCDVVISGEADEVIVEVVGAALSGTRVESPCVHYGRPEQSDVPRIIIGDPSKIEPAAYGEIDEEMAERYIGACYVSLARGCPHRCSFCAHAGFYRGKITHKPIKSLVGELMRLVARFPFLRERLFIMQHVSFGVNRGWALEFCSELARSGTGLAWVTDIRPDSVLRLSDEGLSLMRKAGCIGVLMGIESMTPQALANTRKAYSPDHIMAALKMLRRNGYLIYTYWMVGLPGETFESVIHNVVLASLRLLDEGLVDVVQPHLIQPVPGAEIWSSPESSGLFRSVPEPSSGPSFFSFSCYPRLQSGSLNGNELFGLYLAYLAGLAKRKHLQSSNISKVGVW